MSDPVVQPDIASEEAKDEITPQNADTPVMDKDQKPDSPAIEDYPDEGTDNNSKDLDRELEIMKARLKKMEEQSKKEHDEFSSLAGHPALDPANKASDIKPNTEVTQTPDINAANVDERSVYVGNVDYAATGDQLSAHFAVCGTINRVTILTNKLNGAPKGFAYIEFNDAEAAQNALILHETDFLGRQLKVVPKRRNIPMVYRGPYRGRARWPRSGRGYGRRGRRSRGRWNPY